MAKYTSRYEQTRNKYNFTSKDEQSDINKSMEEEEERRRKKEEAKRILETEPSYKLLKMIANTMDNCFLDPIIGFFFPEVGDTVSAVLILPYLYVSIFKIKSLPLTLAILKTTLADWLVGMIPVVGDILDAFHKSYNKSYRLIVGYVEDDKEIIKEVRNSAVISGILVLILFTLCAGMWYLVYSVFTHIFG